ncbi:MAG: hypothetical protein Kapaf2KO_16550 [Candidatus Kapaibacteriales bacterium]
MPLPGVNSENDEYGAVFRKTLVGTEIWFNTSVERDPRSKKLVMAELIDGDITSLTSVQEPINIAGLSGRKQDLTGNAYFPFCSNTGYFTSNRERNGISYGIDIYRVDWLSNKNPTVSLESNLNSDFWDDSPSVHPKGEYMFFSSDRETPNTGRSDIYYSRRTSTGWSTPKKYGLLTSFHDNKSVQTPFAWSDAYLYYSTNDSDNGDYDIWKVQLNPDGRPNDVRFSENPIKLYENGINLPNIDDSHPGMSPAGNWFVFSSNRGAGNVPKLDRDIYYLKNPEVYDTLYLKTNVNTRKYNEYLGQYEDTIQTLSGSNIILKDLADGKETIIPVDDSGVAIYPISRLNASSSIYNDSRIKTVTITSDFSKNDFFVPVDTLVYDVFCDDDIEHTLTLTDTAIYYDQSCASTFSQKDVQFFVTGYYCPTTNKYKYLSLCTSVFANRECGEINWDEPLAPCSDNELWGYDVKFTRPTIQTSQNGGSCIRYEEINNYSLIDQRAAQVDIAIDNFVEVMKSTMTKYCVEQALQQKQIMDVYVMGFADPRGVGSCLYSGPDIDFKQYKGYLELVDWEKKSYLVDGVLKNGTNQRPHGINGNQILTDLRAFHTAWILDEVWIDQVPGYKELRESGLIVLHAEGIDVTKEEVENYKRIKGSPEADRYLAERRRVNVRFEVPSTQGKKNQNIAQRGGTFVFCGQTDCMPKPSGAQSIVDQMKITKDDGSITFDKVIDINSFRSQHKPRQVVTNEPDPVPPNSGIDGECWKVTFMTSKSKDQALSMAGEVGVLGVEIETTEYQGRDGTSYRVSTGCWATRKEAITAYKWIKYSFDQQKQSIANLDMINIQIAKQ